MNNNTITLLETTLKLNDNKPNNVTEKDIVCKIKNGNFILPNGAKININMFLLSKRGFAFNQPDGCVFVTFKNEEDRNLFTK